MTTPDRAESGPEQPSAKQWDWAVDPPPPTGPASEPTPDPAADGGSVDQPAADGGYVAQPAADPTPPWSTPQTPPPDWSTPATPVTAPPFGGPPTNPPPDWPPYANAPTDSSGRVDRGPLEALWSPTGGGRGVEGGPVGGGAAGGQPESARTLAGNHRIWLILGIAAMLLSCCCVTAAVVALTWGDDIYEELRERREPSFALNQPARDGDLEFRVHQVECGYDSVGDPFVNQSAVGQFCVAELTIRNLGGQPATFVDSLQRAYGPDGEDFHPDSTASMLANGDQAALLNELSPGAETSGALVYDIPRDSRIVRLRLHATPTSPGALIRTP